MEGLGNRQNGHLRVDDCGRSIRKALVERPTGVFKRRRAGQDDGDVLAREQATSERLSRGICANTTEEKNSENHKAGHGYAEQPTPTPASLNPAEKN